MIEEINYSLEMRWRTLTGELVTQRKPFMINSSVYSVPLREISFKKIQRIALRKCNVGHREAKFPLKKSSYKTRHFFNQRFT